jgi:hypothetical protein
VEVLYEFTSVDVQPYGVNQIHRGLEEMRYAPGMEVGLKRNGMIMIMHSKNQVIMHFETITCAGGHGFFFFFFFVLFCLRQH